MKSNMLRWRNAGLCTLTVIALMALISGCSKKEEEAAESTETSEMASEPVSSPMAGTYTAETMAGGPKVSLMLNADNTAMFSVDASADQPAMVHNGTWAMGMGANQIDVTVTGQMGDSTMTHVLNFSAAGDTLVLTNGGAVGVPQISLVKVMATGHEGHSH